MEYRSKIFILRSHQSSFGSLFYRRRNLFLGARASAQRQYLDIKSTNLLANLSIIALVKYLTFKWAVLKMEFIKHDGSKYYEFTKSNSRNFSIEKHLNKLEQDYKDEHNSGLLRFASTC